MYNIKSFKGFNWIGFFTLYKKEVKRFFNVFAQTILAPAVTTILFYLIFTLSMDRDFLVSNKSSLLSISGPWSYLYVNHAECICKYIFLNINFKSSR